MRITGGMAGGRHVCVPQNGVRPTQDRVRAALFNILAPAVPQCRFLDLCAGSGAVGLEAWSRGAAFVCWVERDRRVAEVLRRNIEEIGAEGQVVATDAATCLKKKLVAPGFGIIFCDPPYEKAGKPGVLAEILGVVRAGDFLIPGGWFVMEQDVGQGVDCPAGWQLADDRVYGQTRLLFFRLPDRSCVAEPGGRVDGVA